MGTDKGFLRLHNKAFIEYSIEALQPLVSQTLIVSNNPDYDVFGLKRVDDLIADAGPLAGIYTGLKHSKTKYNLVLSCDIPLIRKEILEKLLEAEDEKYDILQIESNGKSMPLIARYKRTCEPVFYKLLQNDERALHSALNHCKVKNIVLNSENQVYTTNINTPEDLKTIAHDTDH